MANLQNIIGGDNAPVHNDNLNILMNQTGSILGQSLEFEEALATRLVENLTNPNNNVLNLKHSIAFTHSHSADTERFEKSLSRMIIPTVQSLAIQAGAVETPFVAAPQHRVPFIGETIKDDPAHVGQKFICTGHKYVLSSATPTQIINACINCPWEVMTKCVYFNNGRYWNIVNIKELLNVILKAKITLFNNNEITKYKQQHKEQFMFMNRRNGANNRGMTIFVTRVTMNLTFSSAATTVMDIRETRNQIGRLAWTVAAQAAVNPIKVNSIVAKQTPAGMIIENYNHNSYEANIAGIDDDAGIVNRNDFVFTSNVTVGANGRIVNAGANQKYKLVRTALNDYGNTTQAACLFPANARVQFNGGRNGAIPQGVLNINGAWAATGVAITAVQLRAMFSTLEVKVATNQAVTVN